MLGCSHADGLMCGGARRQEARRPEGECKECQKRDLDVKGQGSSCGVARGARRFECVALPQRFTVSSQFLLAGAMSA